MNHQDQWAKFLSTARVRVSRTGSVTVETDPGLGSNDERGPFLRDYDRILFSSSFRRLADKTQVFPMPANDHVHSRLTHSLEVAAVGRSLGINAGRNLRERNYLPEGSSLDSRDVGDIVAAACLAHDLGNPPFGHSGEDAIATWFTQYLQRESSVSELLNNSEREDLTRFDGNGQGFRLITRLEMVPFDGMRLTCATLATFMKYPCKSDLVTKMDVANKKAGFFQSECEVFEKVAEATGMHRRAEVTSATWYRHPLAFLVEAADDICNRILDLEDGVRVGLIESNKAKELLTRIASQGGSIGSFEWGPDDGDEIAFLRAKSMTTLVNQVGSRFKDHLEEIVGGTFPSALVDDVGAADVLRDISSLVKERCYQARDVLETELAGFEILGGLLDVFVSALMTKDPTKREKKVLALLPRSFVRAGTPMGRLQQAVDYVAGMTDSFALSTYRSLKGIDLPHRLR